MRSSFGTIGWIDGAGFIRVESYEFRSVTTKISKLISIVLARAAVVDKK